MIKSSFFSLILAAAILAGLAPTQALAATGVPTPSMGAAYDFPADISYFTRSEWGADESWRLPPPPKEDKPEPAEPAEPSLAWQKRIADCVARQKNYPADFARSDKVVTKTDDGLDLYWPLQYSTQIRKIVIHHTDGNQDFDYDKDGKLTVEDSKAGVRAVYRSHALSNGWGDIGYNLLVDQFGNVFEGRAGGQMVISAHAYCANAQTVGISVLGSYDDRDITPATRATLDRLIGYLSLLYGLDPAAESEFQGKLTRNVVGHRDYVATTCPGKYMYAQLGSMADSGRFFLANYRDQFVAAAKEEFKSGYSGQVVSQPGPITLADGNQSSVKLTFKNTGSEPWVFGNRSSPRLALRSENLTNSKLTVPASWPLGTQPKVTISTSRVQPGETVTFSFSVQKNAPGRVREGFALAIPGQGWVTDIGYVDIVPDKKVAANPAPVASQQIQKLDSPAVSAAAPAESVLVAHHDSGVSHAAASIPADGPTIRIRLGFVSDRVEIGGGTFSLQDTAGKELFRGNFATFDAARLTDNQAYRLVPDSGVILRVENWNHAPAWNPKLNDNAYRGILEIRKLDGTLRVINELPVEQYLRGVAEPLPTDPTEKAKMLAVLARSYAYFYTLPENRKYPGQPYDGSDSPAEFQKYLGYGYESRGNMPAATEATRGMIVTYEDKPVKTPYFTQSDGWTRLPREAGWPVEPFRFTQKVKDPWSCGLTSAALADSSYAGCPGSRRGHGVGISGMGATGLANEGKTWQGIINYFYRGVEFRQEWGG